MTTGFRSLLGLSIGQMRQYDRHIELPGVRNMTRFEGGTSVERQEIDLQTVLPGIQSLVGIREALDRIVAGVVDGLGYTGAMLSVLDKKKQTLTVQAIAFNDFVHMDTIETMYGLQLVGSSASLLDDKDNLGVKTCLEGKTLITHNLFDVFRPVVDLELSCQIQEATRVKTCVSLPLLLEGKVVGSLCVVTEKEEVSQSDLEALHFFVTNAAIAVQNSILFERVSRKLALRESELNQLREIERMIHSSLDLPEVLKRILDGAIKLTKAEYGHVVLVGNYGAGLVQRVTYPEGRKILNNGTLGLTQLVMRDKRPKIIDNSRLAELRNNKLEYLTGKNYRLYSYSKMKSQLSVPVLLDAELIGVIHIAGKKKNRFNKHPIEMTEQLAVQAAIAIRNADQFKNEREMRERMSNLAQVAAMGDMAGNMVHSINNWVGSIRADLNHLKRQQALAQPDQNEMRELLDDMLANAEATLAMAENIRKPFQALTQEPIDVNECILNMLQAKKGQSHNVMIIKDFNDVPLVMATQQLELVFENLLNNALQAMRNKSFGILKFATQWSVDGRWVEAVIKDSGPGLPEGMNESEIFKLGVSSRTDGLGYGLWWCDMFLKRWGGNIQLIENTKAGCRFLVKLPIYVSSMGCTPPMSLDVQTNL